MCALVALQPRLARRSIYMGCSESAHAAAIREFKADQKAAGVPVYAPDVKTVDEKERKKIGCRYNYRRNYRHMVYVKEMGGLDKYESINGWIQSFPEPKLRELMAMHPEVRYDASPGWEKGSVNEKLSGKAVGREFAPCYTWGITKTVRMISTPALGGASRVAQPGEVDADDGSVWLRNERLYPEECAYYGIAPPILRSFDEQRELLTKGGDVSHTDAEYVDRPTDLLTDPTDVLVRRLHPGASARGRCEDRARAPDCQDQRDA